MTGRELRYAMFSRVEVWFCVTLMLLGLVAGVFDRMLGRHRR